MSSKTCKRFTNQECIGSYIHCPLKEKNCPIKPINEEK
jgi:hypothetical protein